MSIFDGLFNRNHLNHLPLNCWLFGLKDIPAVPYSVGQALECLGQLAGREQQVKQAKSALSNEYTIDGTEATGYQFMYQKESQKSHVHASDARQEKFNKTGRNTFRFGQELVIQNFPSFHLGKRNKKKMHDSQPLTSYSLDKAEQFTMSWTTFPNVYEEGQKNLASWVASLESADEATKQFWPTIATYGLAYNMLLLQKVGASQIGPLKKIFRSVWGQKFDELYEHGRLYVIDLSIFKTLQPHYVAGFERFTPNTITLLGQDPESKAITPLAIRVAGHQDTGAQIYFRDKAQDRDKELDDKQATDSAWLYALQAAKTSVTVYGIWLGHVYHWHMVTAAMQMTMYNTLPTTHSLYKLLAPQSQDLVGFDTVLLAIWKELAPPTSIHSGYEFLKLCNEFAKGRHYFYDDPKPTLDRLGLNKADFTKDKDWDLYPIVANYLRIWRATKNYVDVCVEELYSTNDAVIHDEKLQKWIKHSKDKKRGNIQGLPNVDSKQELKKVLTSLIYRVTAHGVSRLHSEALPAFTFVANFPPCLQDSHIPKPSDTLTPEQLLAYLPKTGTIGKMIDFYFIFVYSAPHKPFIPLTGLKSDFFFDENYPKCNGALETFRRKIQNEIGKIQKTPQIHQWPLNVET